MFYILTNVAFSSSNPLLFLAENSQQDQGPMNLNPSPASPWSSCIKCLKFNAGAYSIMSSRERSKWKANLLGYIPVQAFVFMFPPSSHGCWNSLPSEHSSVRTWWPTRCRDRKMSLLKNYSKRGSFWPSPFAPAEFSQHSRGLGVRIICSNTWESVCFFLGKFRRWESSAVWRISQPL